MAWTYEQLIAKLTSDYVSAASTRNLMVQEINAADVDWAIGDDHAAIKHLISAGAHASNVFFFMLMKRTYGYNGQTITLTTALDPAMAFPSLEEYVLTAEKICEAWAKDDFNFAPVTIAFIDRMRQLIWDEPFNAVWASAPEKEF